MHAGVGYPPVIKRINAALLVGAKDHIVTSSNGCSFVKSGIASQRGLPARKIVGRYGIRWVDFEAWLESGK
jgi:hypothetical protein